MIVIRQIIVGLIWFHAIAFSFAENNYFGWNHVASSDAELMADGFQTLFFVLALLASLVLVLPRDRR